MWGYNNILWEKWRLWSQLPPIFQDAIRFLRYSCKFSIYHVKECEKGANINDS